jgi:hypothetical protein
MHRQPLIVLRCLACGERVEIDAATAAERLRALGFLRRGGEPTIELLLELAREAVATGRLIACANCGGGTFADVSNDASQRAASDSELWPGDVRACEQCGQSIDPERIELFPATTLCTPCQRKVDAGGATNDHEYCPRCGDILQLRPRRSGLASYGRYCQSCGKYH